MFERPSARTAGRVTSATSNNGTETYTYDSTGQILTTDYSDYIGSPANTTYSYTLNGNPSGSGISLNLPGGGATATDKGNNQVATEAGVTYTYNANGNLTEESSSSETSYYTYDFRNRLTRVEIVGPGGVVGTINYTYDMYNRLIGRTQSSTLPRYLRGLDYLASDDVYVYDGANPAMEFTNMSGSMGETQRFLWGPAVDQLLGVELIEDGSTYELWPVTDNQHSVQELLYQNDEEDYLAYNAQGQPLGEGYPGLEMYWAGAVGFTGAFMDPVTGLQYMSTGNGGGRWYNPSLSRWMTQDPSGVGTNLYEYCFNSPTDFTDSDGLSPISDAQPPAAPLPGSAPRSAASFSPAEIADIMGANTSDPIPCGPCATRVPPSMNPGSSFPSSHVITFTTAAGGYVRLIVSDDGDASGLWPDDDDYRSPFLFTGAGFGNPATGASLSPSLPPYSNNVTLGLLMLDEGGTIYLRSGCKFPAFSNYPISGHVEGKSAFIMRQTGSTGGILYHNNPGGTCGFCNSQLETVLPEGVPLDVVPPPGAVAFKPGAVAGPGTYIGNSAPLKPNLDPIAGETPVFSLTEAPVGVGPQEGGFLGGNGNALGAAAVVSALNGFATGLDHVAIQSATKQVNNPRTDPYVALYQVQFLRDKFDEAHSGLSYACGHLTDIAAAQREEAAGHAYFNKLEAYWKDQQLIAATVQANMPKINNNMINEGVTTRSYPNQSFTDPDTGITYTY